MKLSVRKNGSLLLGCRRRLGDWSRTRRELRPFSSNTKCINGLDNQTCAIIGSQWGDEGKGKLADVLAKRYDIVARFNGGSNAGHTIIFDNKRFAFHLLPCGLIYPHTLNVLGNGVVVDLEAFFSEIGPLKEAGIEVDHRIKISNRAPLLFGFHKTVDQLMEERKGDNKIGTTKKGIGPAYASKALRLGLRVGDLLHWDSFVEQYHALGDSLAEMFQFEAAGISYNRTEELDKLKGYREWLIKNDVIIDTVYELNKRLQAGKKLIVEGANAALLDLDFGSYPYVTSSNTTIGNVFTGLGIPHNALANGAVIGVVKAYTTRVGSGPFPTELDYETHPIGKHLQEVGREVGVTTGRRRRCGWLDIPLLSYSHLVNHYSSINITKLDVLDDLDEVQLCVQYQEKSTGKKLELGQFPSTMIDLGKVEPVFERFKGWKQDLSAIKDYGELPSEAKTYLEAIETLLGVNVSWIGVGASREQMIVKE